MDEVSKKIVALVVDRGHISKTEVLVAFESFDITLVDYKIGRLVKSGQLRWVDLDGRLELEAVE